MKKGYKVENKIMNMLKESGYFTARITGSGLSSAGDLVAISPNGRIYLTEIKSTKSKYPIYVADHFGEQLKELKRVGKEFPVIPVVIGVWRKGRGKSIVIRVYEDLSKEKYEEDEGKDFDEFFKREGKLNLN